MVAGLDIQQIAAVLGIDYRPPTKEEIDETNRRDEEIQKLLESETRAERMARHEANMIEEMLRDGIPSLCVAQIARDSGFNSDKVLRFIESELSGAEPGGPQPGFDPVPQSI